MTVILTITGVIICQILLFILAYIVIRSKIRRFQETIKAYFQGDQEHPSEANILLDTISKKFAGSFTASIKANLLAFQSASVRQERQLAGALVEDSAPPLLGALLSQFPAVGKIIRKNPELAQMLMQSVASLGARPGNNGQKQVEHTDNSMTL